MEALGGLAVGSLKLRQVTGQTCNVTMFLHELQSQSFAASWRHEGRRLSCGRPPSSAVMKEVPGAGDGPGWREACRAVPLGEGTLSELLTLQQPLWSQSC